MSFLQLPPPNHYSINGQEDVPPLLLLPHNRDAISFLLTAKRYAYAILPLFRVPKTVARTYHSYSKNTVKSNTNDGIIYITERYRFVVLPIQDPRTLLDRLNTRRLRARIVWSNRMMKEKRHLESSNEDNTKKLNTHVMTNRSDRMACYEYGRTIEELAFEEWSMMKIHHADASHENDTQGIGNDVCKLWRVWPAHLELLQFLDGFDNEQSKNSREEGAEGAFTRDFRGPILPSGVTFLASYPRSGNTLLRTLIERITSVVTGSDTRPDRTLSRSLALDHDLVGEGLVGGEPVKRTSSTNSSVSSRSLLLHQNAFDPLVHIVKTHFPERKGWKPLAGNRFLLLLRNPYDAIDSYWNLCCTNTHTRTLDETVYARYSQKFEDLAKHEIQIWCNFHYYWMDISKKEGVPMLIVRYEDLVLDTEAEMRRIMAFVLNMEDGTLDSFWEWRLRHAISCNTSTNGSLPSNHQTSNLGSYEPRSSNGGPSSIGKSVRKGRFSEGVLLHMHEVAASLALERKQKYMNIISSPNFDSQQSNKTLLQRFGYDIYEQQFPDKFERLEYLSSLREDWGRGCGSTMTINRTLEIRRKDDPFGRAMTFWRRGETNDDKAPFPTVPR